MSNVAGLAGVLVLTCAVLLGVSCRDASSDVRDSERQTGHSSESVQDSEPRQSVADSSQQAMPQGNQRSNSNGSQTQAQVRTAEPRSIQADDSSIDQDLGGPWAPEGDQYSLVRMKSCAELLEVFRRGTLSNPWYYLEPDPDGDSPYAPDAEDPHHLMRKTQQRLNARLNGVEEADIVKTDGEYVYSMTNDSLVVSKPSSRKAAELISRVHLNTRISPRRSHAPVRSELILIGEKVVAIRSWGNSYPFAGKLRGSEVQIYEIDVRDPAGPVVERELVLNDAELLAAWLVGDQLHLTAWHIAPGTELQAEWQVQDDPDPKLAARRHNETAVRGLGIADWQPSFEMWERESRTNSSGLAVPCEDTYVSIAPFWQPHNTYLMSFDVTRDIATWQATAVLTDYYTTHATTENVYFARSHDLPQVNAQIHQFRRVAREGWREVGYYRFDGHLASQRPLDEHGGLLRVVAQVVEPDVGWVPELLVLRPNDSPAPDGLPAPLRLVGQRTGDVEPFWPRHIRLVKHAAYITPFPLRSEDLPSGRLFVVDLASPTEPKIVHTLDIVEMTQNVPTTGDPVIPAAERMDVLELTPDLIAIVGRVADSDNPDRAVAVTLLDVSQPLTPIVVDVVKMEEVEFSPYEFDDRAALVADGWLWVPVGVTYGGHRTAFVGFRFESDGLVHERTVPVVGNATGPPGLRAISIGDAVHFVSNWEIRSFNVFDGVEVGVLLLSE